MTNQSHKTSVTNNLKLFSEAQQASLYVAHQIANLINEKEKQGKPAVLGLATGNTPKGVYQELIRLHQNEALSFKNVISFNLDEYYPILPDDQQSYTYFMRQFLFKHVDIKPEHTHIPHTDFSEEGIAQYCQEYEDKIESLGGLDLQLLGIGRNGHIGFNEPGSSFESKTRLVHLNSVTREDAKAAFGSMDKVPQKAISIGVDTISKAKKIILLALGKRKSDIMKLAIHGDVTTQVPASILQTLPQAEFVLDHGAAGEIKS
ncbi:glucosamine-6-phosphate deaminase [Psychroflexus halocasei]|uniref:Glucosamine-6-phosphate deaminase n=1 Tax=Psychroflexus halocasei TaxID=908615 RepID=A0A1H4DB05_9FLAO|nr:glucosamine-6-phosphate deaminase [Psychroflexus halocasei]SEA69630.1 glucosamine-6-phosphate deaminase [Psychroflexus halocasei]